jgi:hypothetical protein
MTLDEIVRTWTAGEMTSEDAMAEIVGEGLFAEAFMIALTHTKAAPPVTSP